MPPGSFDLGAQRLTLCRELYPKTGGYDDFYHMGAHQLIQKGVLSLVKKIYFVFGTRIVIDTKGIIKSVEKQHAHFPPHTSVCRFFAGVVAGIDGSFFIFGGCGQGGK